VHRKAKILVVDDSKVMRRIVARCLNSLGFKNISEAGNGIEALDVVENDGVDLVLTDWCMPKMYGIDLLRALRSNPGTEKLPVVMITAEAQEHLIEEAMAAGASYYIAKPFTCDVVQKALARVLGR